MDAEIRQQLIDAEEDLLSALSDESLLSPFYSTWSKLYGDISDMELQGKVTKETLALAHVVASRISMIVQCFLDLQQEEKLLRTELASGLEDILNGRDDSSITSVSSRSSEERSTLFVKTVYNWLLENIHNPYPSAQFKASVAKTCNCSQNSVNNWFVNVRRRIGWTSLCREQFRSCRADALDAAYRALVRPDPTRPLPAAVFRAFVDIKSNAEGLYSSMCPRRSPAKDLDLFADVAEYTRGTLGDEVDARQRTFGRKAEAHTFCENRRSEATMPYPSPFLSPPPPASAIPTLIPSLSDESDDDDQDVAPPVLAGRKRRAGLLENQCAVRTEHPKRLCIRPSPTPSTDASEPPSDEETRIHPSLELQASRALPRTRKRRLSEGAQPNIPKRPHCLPVAPRPQAVSDPLPRTTISDESDIEDWFQTNFQTLFDLPAPVECSDLDPSTQWEVLFGRYSMPSASLQSEVHLMHSPPTSSQVVLQDVQERGGDSRGFDDLFLPLGNAVCENTLPGIRSSTSHLSPEHQFGPSDGTSSVGGVSFLDDWISFCEPTPQTESISTHAPSELDFFEFPDLSVSQPPVEGQVALVLEDFGLLAGA